jgi:hypothetical protein
MGMNAGYESGWPPIGSDSALSRQIPFATRVHARQTARPRWTAAGSPGEWLVGLSRWVGWVLAD